jgi:hypothetical protein
MKTGSWDKIIIIGTRATKIVGISKTREIIILIKPGNPTSSRLAKLAARIGNGNEMGSHTITLEEAVVFRDQIRMILGIRDDEGKPGVGVKGKDSVYVNGGLTYGGFSLVAW